MDNHPTKEINNFTTYVKESLMSKSAREGKTTRYRAVLVYTFTHHIDGYFLHKKQRLIPYPTRPVGHVTGNLIFFTGDGEKEDDKAPLQVLKACKHKHG